MLNMQWRGSIKRYSDILQRSWQEIIWNHSHITSDNLEMEDDRSRNKKLTPLLLSYFHHFPCCFKDENPKHIFPLHFNLAQCWWNSQLKSFLLLQGIFLQEDVNLPLRVQRLEFSPHPSPHSLFLAGPNVGSSCGPCKSHSSVSQTHSNIFYHVT